MLVIRALSAESDEGAASLSGERLPEDALRSCGYHVSLTQLKTEVKRHLEDADAAVLHVPVSDILTWTDVILKCKAVPVLWWCSDKSAALSVDACENNVIIDGLLTPSMSSQELHWALHFGAKVRLERQQWQQERLHLQSRIEERKWIDMAKGILCDLKNISEAEAYDLLRTQAMNERKRMVDVATSIVRVYQLLQDQKRGPKRT